MWLIYVLLYLILTVIFTQFYKIATKTSFHDGALTVLMQVIAAISVLLLCPFFQFKFPRDFRVYLFLGIAIIFYAISDRMNTFIRAGIEASTFSIIQQLSTVFMIMAGLLFFKEAFVVSKMIGAMLIVFSNILIFYKKGRIRFNKYVVFGILSNMAYTVGLFLDVNISESFNLAFYVALTLIVPALLIFLFERIKVSMMQKEFADGNKRAILITGISWGAMIVTQLRAYQLGQVTSVAPLCALAVILNVLAGYLFLKEKDNLLKKLIAALFIMVSIILIQF